MTFAESKEINDFISDKSAKNCHDKINNLDKKYKTVMDKRKLTGEGSKGIKSFTEFDALAEMWGTRDSGNPKYVVEAGTSHTPVPSLSSSLAGQSRTNTATSSQQSEIDEEAPLSQALARSGIRGKKVKTQLETRENELDLRTMSQQMTCNVLQQAKRLFFQRQEKARFEEMCLAKRLNT